ncbi:MAG: hypothetical protein FDX30_01450 [Chlorobium sp.]|jgi:hypothetical protein|nr:MAG: hypothetical protein FDX30_01450 [Chlorobium sp.]
MGKANKEGNNTKPGLKISIFHVLVTLVGADLILLFAPEIGLIYYVNSSFSDIYAWSALIIGFILLIYGLKGVYKKP